jgi:GNAT superfamily N-acetyltransferase
MEQHGELVFNSYTHGRTLNLDSELDRMLARPDWWQRAAASMPDYDPQQTRVMVESGKLVCSVTCYPRLCYVAGRLARAACIGSVCTHPTYRRRGLLRQVLSDAIDWIRSQRILWSFLYGNEEVYRGSGWRHLTSWSVAADLRVRDAFGAHIDARPVDLEADLPTLIATYERFNSPLTGPVVRTEQYWRTRVLRAERASEYSILTNAGRAIGYYVGTEGRSSEIAWTEGGRDVLAFLLRRWSGTVSLPLCIPGVVEALRDISLSPAQGDYYRHSGGIALEEASRGLWQHHGDPEGFFPEFSDTAGLLRFLREHDYVMWPVGRL